MSWAQVDLVHGCVVRRGRTEAVFRVVSELLGELGRSFCLGSGPPRWFVKCYIRFHRSKVSGDMSF